MSLSEAQSNVVGKAEAEAMSGVKVGDVVTDPALLEVGMKLRWVLADFSPGAWPWRGTFGFGSSLSEAAIRKYGVRILALPPKTESSTGCDTCDSRLRCLSHPLPLSTARPELLPPKCTPGCTPATPCWTNDDSRDEHFYCPAFRERSIDTKMREDFHASGLVPEGLYEPRPTRYLPLRHAGNAGFAIWGRR